MNGAVQQAFQCLTVAEFLRERRLFALQVLPFALARLDLRLPRPRADEVRAVAVRPNRAHGELPVHDHFRRDSAAVPAQLVDRLTGRDIAQHEVHIVFDGGRRCCDAATVRQRVRPQCVHARAAAHLTTHVLQIDQPHAIQPLLRTGAIQFARRLVELLRRDDNIEPARAQHRFHGILPARVAHLQKLAQQLRPFAQNTPQTILHALHVGVVADGALRLQRGDLVLQLPPAFAQLLVPALDHSPLLDHALVRGVQLGRGGFDHGDQARRLRRDGSERISFVNKDAQCLRFIRTQVRHGQAELPGLALHLIAQGAPARGNGIGGAAVVLDLTNQRVALLRDVRLIQPLPRLCQRRLSAMKDCLGLIERVLGVAEALLVCRDVAGGAFHVTPGDFLPQQDGQKVILVAQLAEPLHLLLLRHDHAQAFDALRRSLSLGAQVAQPLAHAAQRIEAQFLLFQQPLLHEFVDIADRPEVERAQEQVDETLIHAAQLVQHVGLILVDLVVDVHAAQLAQLLASQWLASRREQVGVELAGLDEIGAIRAAPRLGLDAHPQRHGCVFGRCASRGCWFGVGEFERHVGHRAPRAQPAILAELATRVAVDVAIRGVLRRTVEPDALEVGDEHQLNGVEQRGLAGAVVPRQIQAVLDVDNAVIKAMPVVQEDAGE